MLLIELHSVPHDDKVKTDSEMIGVHKKKVEWFGKTHSSLQKLSAYQRKPQIYTEATKTFCSSKKSK